MISYKMKLLKQLILCLVFDNFLKFYFIFRNKIKLFQREITEKRIKTI